MLKLFNDSDNSDTEVNFQTNNAYAKRYNNWRQKEELCKLKAKYGEDAGSSSSEDESDDAPENEEFERDFLKTLASLKKKDPKIYDEKIHFFKDTPIDVVKSKKPKDRPMYIHDYERKILLEKDGIISDDEDYLNKKRPRSPTYIEEQERLKENFKKVDIESSDEDENFGGGILKKREKTKEEIEQNEEDYKQWLLGETENINDKETEKELKPLKEYWNDPKLNENEKFLRDYILNKKYLETNKSNNFPTYEDIVHDSDKELSEDEKQIEKQEEFEHKFNYRFEEPDQEFIKRYPRTMENSVRQKDDKRKLKRAEVKERKQQEKEHKMQEIRKLRELKKKEIEEKIKKLKEITGNDELAFDAMDIDGDFDPEAHDKHMQTLFNEEFYQVEEGEQKPTFSSLDKELEIEDWDQYGENEDCEEQNSTWEPHCEDDNFIMDCDYDPTTNKNNSNISGPKRKNRNRRSKFAEVISEPKPIYNPEDKTYEQYLDEYYKLDCEDIIGDIPCRFKYRKVVPNSFGLTIDEILNAKDRELNRWCSLKKAVQYRPDHIEKYDITAFSKKAENVTLKRKILPSLFEEENTKYVIKPSTFSTDNPDKKQKNMKQKHTANNQAKSEGAQNKPKETATAVTEENCNNIGLEENVDFENTENNCKTKTDIVYERSKTDATPKKKKKKNKSKEQNNESKMTTSLGNYIKQDNLEDSKVESLKNKECDTSSKKKKRNKNAKQSTGPKAQGDKQIIVSSGESTSSKVKENSKKSKKRKFAETEMGKNKNKNSFKKVMKNDSNDISDARLRAFGIKPKKFKNKLIYGKKSKS